MHVCDTLPFLRLVVRHAKSRKAVQRGAIAVRATLIAGWTNAVLCLYDREHLGTLGFNLDLLVLAEVSLDNTRIITTYTERTTALL